jgi:hypothetical protein
MDDEVWRNIAHGRDSMLHSELDHRKWRAFRLFLVSLEEEEFEVVRTQLEREVISRLECDTSAVRLFFSSLMARDLETARNEIDFVFGGPVKTERRRPRRSRVCKFRALDRTAENS